VVKSINTGVEWQKPTSTPCRTGTRDYALASEGKTPLGLKNKLVRVARTSLNPSVNTYDSVVQVCATPNPIMAVWPPARKHIRATRR